MKGYPKWFSKNLIHTVFVVTFLSGLVLLPTTLEMKMEWQVPWRATENYRIWLTAVHVLAGFLICAVIGALTTVHMRSGWLRRVKRPSGVMVTSTFVFLILSSVAILYSGNEKISLYSSISHSVAGLIIAALYGVHSLVMSAVQRKDSRRPIE